jgi:hypothetical protein
LHALTNFILALTPHEQVDHWYTTNAFFVM